MPHINAEDDYYHDRLILKGTCVLSNLTALHRDPDLYPEPEKFESDRFKDDHLDASASAIQPDYRQRDHFSYGFGRRLVLPNNLSSSSSARFYGRLISRPSLDIR